MVNTLVEGSSLKAPQLIAFDADDTLWLNEPIYTDTQKKFNTIIQPFLTSCNPDEILYQTEMRNLKIFGYGIKGFVLSMIETAIEISNGKISSRDIGSIINLGKEMINHPVLVLDGVRETLNDLSQHYKLMIITKGDLFDQESKIARSGLVDKFSHIEIVTRKDSDIYSTILKKYKVTASQFLMVGNSLKSDILPVSDLGGHAVHIPYDTTWQHEEVDVHEIKQPYHVLENINHLSEYLEEYFDIPIG
jgi:putative hydrolase of the HAD superfamily